MSRNTASLKLAIGFASSSEVRQKGPLESRRVKCSWEEVFEKRFGHITGTFRRTYTVGRQHAGVEAQLFRGREQSSSLLFRNPPSAADRWDKKVLSSTYLYSTDTSFHSKLSLRSNRVVLHSQTRSKLKSVSLGFSLSLSVVARRAATESDFVSFCIV